MPNIVKNTTFPGLLDLLAPHSCRGCGRLGSPLCDRCKNYIISHHQTVCPNCKTIISVSTLAPQKSPLKSAFKSSLNPAQPLSLDKFRCPNCPNLPPAFLVGPKDGLLGDLIRSLKFDSVRALAKPLAEILDQTLPKLPKNTVIIPLPTISKHIRARGLDHTLLIAKNLAKIRNLKVEKLLLRAKNTVQVGSNAKTRKSQAASAYVLNPKIKIDPNTTYLLLDDVWTTGASMQAAHKTLSTAGAKDISLAIIARSDLAPKTNITILTQNQPRKTPHPKTLNSLN